MIYVTVGTYPLGFDRLIRALDFVSSEIDTHFVAQISGGKYQPKNIEYERYFEESKHFELINRSKLVIAHGGFGIIGDCLRMEKRLIVAPRFPNEGPNDQRPVASRLAEVYGFELCMDFTKLGIQVKKHLNNCNLKVDYDLNCNISELVNNFLQDI